MVHIFRKHQQTLWIILTIVVIISFVWFFNGNQGGRGGVAAGGGNTVAILNGQNIKDIDVQHDVRRLRVAMSLGLDELVHGLAGNAENDNQAMENFIWNSHVLQHEAAGLQIVPDDAALQAELEKVPAFQTNGQFDGNKLSLFVQDQLPALGFTDSIVDDLLRDVVRLQKIKALINATVTISGAELDSRFTEENQKMDLSVARISTSDFQKTVTISDDEAKKAFDQRKDQFKSDEKRQVKVAAFELTDAQKDLKGAERIKALQALSDKAGDFTQAMLTPNANFDDAAKKAGALVSLTGTFTAEQGDPAFATKVPALAPNAFKLTDQLPTSDALEGSNGYYVIHLQGVTPSTPLTFEQAKPQLLEQMKQQRAGEILQTAASSMRTKLQAGLQGGLSFADAAKAAGLTAETIPPFSLSEASKSDVPDNGQIVQAAVGLGDKQLSEFIPTAAGGLFVYMSTREPISKASVTVGEAVARAAYLRHKQEAAFEEWLRLAKNAAHLQIVGRSQ